MSVREIIESGTLELYVMGALSAKEAGEIDGLRGVHPELNAEILRIEDAMIAYAGSHAVKPDAELKEQIAGKLNFALSLDLDTEKMSILIQMPYVYKFAAAAAIFLIVVSCGTAVYLETSYRHTLSELQAAKDKNLQMVQQAQNLSAANAKIKGELAVALQPENRKIFLPGQAISPQSKAVVYWNQQSGAVYISLTSLPVPPGKKQYQLWAAVNHKPVSLGVIPKNTGFAAMQPTQKASAFCVTLEPLGGSEKPTLEQMYVMVNI